MLFNPNHTPGQKGQINSARPFNLLSDQPNGLQAQPPAGLQTKDIYCLHIAYPAFCPKVLNQDTLAIRGKCDMSFLYSKLAFPSSCFLCILRIFIRQGLLLFLLQLYYPPQNDHKKFKYEKHWIITLGHRFAHAIGKL